MDDSDFDSEADDLTPVEFDDDYPDHFYSYNPDDDSNGYSYDPIRTAEKQGITPEFLHNADLSSQKADNKESAKADLKNSENAALQNGATDKGTNEASINQARNAEKRTAGHTSNVKGRQNKQNEKKKGSRNKKIATALVITLLTGGVALSSFFGQALQPFAYVNNIIQNFNTGSYSMSARLNTTIYSLLGGSSVKTTVKVESTLKEVGIDVDTNADNKIKSLRYVTGDGQTKIITSAAEFEDAINTDSSFKSKISKAGELTDADSFFGKVKSAGAQRIGWDKNRWAKTESESDVKAKFDELAADPSAGDGKSSRHYYQKEVDEDGTVKYKELTEQEYNGLDDAQKQSCTVADESDVKIKTEAEAEAEVKKIVSIDESDGEMKVKTNVDAQGVFDKAASMSKKVSGTLCAYSSIAQSVTALVIAIQIKDMINLASGFLEAVQKCQADGGDCSVMHEYLNRMNMGNFWSAISIQSLFGSLTAKTQSVGGGNLENLLNNKGIIGSLRSVGSSKEMWSTCTSSRLSAAGLDFVSDFIGVFTTGGLLTIAKKIVKSAAFSVGLSVGIGLASKLMIDYAVHEIGFDSIKNLGTREAAERISGGGHEYMYEMGKSIGQTLGTPKMVEEFNLFRIGEDLGRAQYDRENLSPFDITSKNTFLGSIVNSITTFSVLNSANTTPLTKMLSSVSSVVSGSVINMLPSAAASTYSNYASAPGDCPLINDLGAVGDANQCFGFMVSDTGSFPVSYDEALDILCNGDPAQLTDCDTDTPKVVKGSELAKFINYWINRNTHPGIVDGNISSDVEKYSTGNKYADAAIGVIPMLGSLIDIANASLSKENAHYITGSAYVAGGEYWNENKKLFRAIQAFIELDTMYEEFGFVDNSVIANYLDEYYAENPIDNSYEGTLARLSGLPKDTVTNLLAFMDYLDYLANYDPTERYAFAEETEKPVMIDGGSGEEFKHLPVSEIAYFDLRSKNFAI